MYVQLWTLKLFEFTLMIPAGDPVFCKALTKYLQNATIAEEIMRIVPTTLRRLGYVFELQIVRY